MHRSRQGRSEILEVRQHRGSSSIANETLSYRLGRFQAIRYADTSGGCGLHSEARTFSMAMIPLAVNHAIPVGVPAWNDVSARTGKFRVSWPLNSRRFSLFKGAEGLPISCLSCAPTGGNVGQAKANTSNPQPSGRKEDRLKLATESNGRQDAANDICFGC